MKLGKATNNPRVRPFVSNGQLHIEASHAEGKITEFKVEYKGKKFTSRVENFDVLKAWKAVEKFLSNL